MVNGWCDGCKSFDPFTKECLDQEDIFVKEMELYIKAHDIKPLMELVMKAIDNIKKETKMDNNRLKNNPRYCDFTYFENPIMFNEYFKDKDYDTVQVHDIRPVSDIYPDPIGFVGKFEWKSNTITPLDYDSYTSEMPIYGFEEYTSDDGRNCVDILTDKW